MPIQFSIFAKNRGRMVLLIGSKIILEIEERLAFSPVQVAGKRPEACRCIYALLDFRYFVCPAMPELCYQRLPSRVFLGSIGRLTLSRFNQR